MLIAACARLMTRGDDVLLRRDGQISYEDEPGVSASMARVDRRRDKEKTTSPERVAESAGVAANTMGTMKHEAPPTVMVARGYDFRTVGR